MILMVLGAIFGVCSLALLGLLVFERTRPAISRVTEMGLILLTALLVAALVILKWPRPPSDADAFSAAGDFIALALGFDVFVLVGVWGMRRVKACLIGVVVCQLLIGLSVLLSLPAIRAARQGGLPSEPVVDVEIPPDADLAHD
jgi:hypothetical protein